jgi:hypothetical protein
MTKQDLINAGFTGRPFGMVYEYAKSINKKWHARVIMRGGKVISFYFLIDGEATHRPSTETEFWDIVNGIINPD